MNQGAANFHNRKKEPNNAREPIKVSMLDETKFVIKAGEYAIATTGGVIDRVLLGVGARYEENLSRNLSSLHPDEVSALRRNQEVLWSTKYDGEGVLVYYEKDKECFAFSAPSGRARVGLPALDELVKKLKKPVLKRLCSVENSTCP